tara:strand:- start:95 stop:322 length:228 start_codon:yes stop_codon:yes gene_type:complete
MGTKMANAANDKYQTRCDTKDGIEPSLLDFSWCKPDVDLSKSIHDILSPYSDVSECVCDFRRRESTQKVDQETAA